MKELIVDSFAGGGGASLGISWALGRGPDIAINHDKEAIALHAANHPESRHYAEDVWKVDPMEATQGRPVGLMWLSPDCKHFSKAKGGKPISKKVRGLAWIAVRWAEAVAPRIIVLENVEEFQTWGPLGPDDKPCPERKGRTFRAFIAKIRRLGYEVEWKELRACDYGTPTIRRRLFIIARRDGQPIVWPQPTHAKKPVGGQKPWRTAAECIDFTLPCPSIFERKRPLADATLKRIGRGMRKFVIDSPRPFIVNTRNGEREGQLPRIRDLADPMATVTAHGSQGALVAPVVVTTDRPVTNRSLPRSVEEPLPTVTSNQRTAVVSAFLQTYYGGKGPDKTVGDDRGQQLTMPLATQGTANRHGLVAAHLVKHFGERSENEVQGASLADPMPTVTTIDHNGLVAAHLEVMHGTGGGRAIDEPAPAVLANGTHLAEVRAFLTAYYGNEKDGRDLFDPMPTVTAKDRIGLVTVDGHDYAIADIGMRMLVPRELYRAQGFPDSYRIEIPYNGKTLSKTAQVRMVGNSVCPPLAEAIVRHNYVSAGTEAEVLEEIAA